MKANELRIGNWISNGHTNHVISSSWLCDYLGSLGEHMKTEPIPLTEEWLVRLGFERKEDHAPAIGVFHWYENTLVTLNWVSHEKCWVELDDVDSITIKYVHQLQNLYFAITGKEL